MKVRKISGKQAGLVVDLPQDAAEAEIAFGTAERVDEPPALVDEVAAPVSESDPAPEAKKASKKAAKKKRSKKSAS